MWCPPLDGCLAVGFDDSVRACCVELSVTVVRAVVAGERVFASVVPAAIQQFFLTIGVGDKALGSVEGAAFRAFLDLHVHLHEE